MLNYQNSIPAKLSLFILIFFFLFNNISFGEGAGTDFGFSNRLGWFQEITGEMTNHQISKKTGSVFYENSQDHTQVEIKGEREIWEMAGDGGKYIGLSIQRMKARLVFSDPQTKADMVVIVQNVNRTGGLYNQMPEDREDQITIPGASFEHKTPENLILLAGAWDEYSILPFYGLVYSQIVERFLRMGVGYAFGKNQSLKFSQMKGRRIYPIGIFGAHDDTWLEYVWKNPLASRGVSFWKNLQIVGVRKNYHGSPDKPKELRIKNQFKWQTGRVTHFLNYNLMYTDTVSVYQRGIEADSLRELVINTHDTQMGLVYEGFTKWRATPVFIAWGLKTEDSLQAHIFRERAGHLKAVFTW